MLPSAVVAGVAALLGAQSVSASIFQGGQTLNWGCDRGSFQGSCSTSGSFFCNIKSSVYCVNGPLGRTVPTPPSNCFCPSSWNWHTKAEGCVPPVENHNCDCGDGFSWDSGSHQCQPQQSCSGNKWWSAIVGKCCTTNPPAGTCPPGKSCPDNWSWSTSYQHCVPNKPQCPPPQCPTGTTWNPTTKCCGGSTPSSGTGGGSGHGSGGGWGGWRKHKRSDGDFEQSAFDSAYCPDGKVCTVPSPNGSAWSWECINPLTELESCGGCLADGEGVDCTSISHASSVGCVQGKCEVYTCKKGFTPSGDKCAAN